MKTKNLLLGMFICCLSVNIYAQFSGGNGTFGSPYIITTPAQLAQLATYVNEGNTDYNDKYYKLGNDIDLSEYQSGEGWTPIGIEHHPFSGHFDGTRYTVSNLYINSNTLQYAGLFGMANGGSIKNLGITGESSVTIKREWWFSDLSAGAIVGYAEGGVVVDNCYNTGSVKGSEAGGIIGFAGLFTVNNCHNSGSIYASTGDPHSGGIVGQTSYGNELSTINNCYNTGSVYAGMGPGGIVGENNGNLTISNCYNTGSITGNFAAGIIGENKKILTISCCCNLGDISDGDEIGGIIGANESPSLAINNCYNRATVTDASGAGGIVGTNKYSNNSLIITDCYNTGYISGYSHSGGFIGENGNNKITLINCYNIGTILEGEYASAIVGRNESPSLLTINNCHYLNTSINNSGGGTSQTEQFMRTQNFVNILGNSFGIDQIPYINQGYPVLFCTNVVNAIENIKDKDNITFYPNPTKEVLTIKNEELRMENYSIFNVSGQVLMQGALSGENTTINVKVLPNGMYFVKVGNKTGKFVKE